MTFPMTNGAFENRGHDSFVYREQQQVYRDFQPLLWGVRKSINHWISCLYIRILSCVATRDSTKCTVSTVSRYLSIYFYIFPGSSIWGWTPAGN